MARSTYIYLIQGKHTNAIYGAFTVKHECIFYIKRNINNYIQEYVILRHSDGNHILPIVIEATEFIKE